jgi:hypothetical protein
VEWLIRFEDVIQNTPPSKQAFKSNPEMKMKTSLEVLNVICPPQKPTNVGHYHYKKWS